METESDRRHLGWLLAAVGMLLVSTDSLFVRAADTTTWNIAAGVALCSIPFYTILHRLRDADSLTTLLQANWRPLVSIAALACTAQLAFIAALGKTAVANVVVIVAATPLIGALIARLVLGERTTRQVQAAIAITFVGIGIVVTPSLGAPNFAGDMLAGLAIVAFALSVVIWRQHPDLSRPVALLLSAVFMAIIALPTSDLGGLEWSAVAAIAAMGLIFNPLGRVAHSTAPKYAPVAEVALFTPIETVAGTTWAWLFFHERPTVATIVGGAIVIAGVLLGTTRR